MLFLKGTLLLLVAYPIMAYPYASHPIPNVTSSFCDDNVDFTMSSNGPVGTNFSYRMCMDVASSSARLECKEGVPCPSGGDIATSITKDGVIYNIAQNGSCTLQSCPTCVPPNGMPFSFLLIDGANGDESKGVAVYNGTTTMDGTTVDVFVHDRSKVQAGAGLMYWYLSGNDLLRTTYMAPNGMSGSRDFSGTLKADGKGKRVEPAPASSFDIPKNCPSPTSAPLRVVSMWPSMSKSFGDSF